MAERHLRFTESAPDLDARIEGLLAQMTPEEKIGQMVQVHVGMLGWSEVEEADIYEVDGMLDASALMDVAGRQGFDVGQQQRLPAIVRAARGPQRHQPIRAPDEHPVVLGDPRLGRHHGVVSQGDIVGHLHQIVDFGVVADGRCAEFAAVYTGS
mgnify:CR=1 FL=1